MRREDVLDDRRWVVRDTRREVAGGRRVGAANTLVVGDQLAATQDAGENGRDPLVELNAIDRLGHAPMDLFAGLADSALDIQGRATTRERLGVDAAFGH